MKVSEFALLCHILLKRPRYRNRYKFIKKHPKKNARFYELTVYHPFVKIEKILKKKPIESSPRVFTIKAYPCTQYVTRHRDEKTVKIMAGRNETSVIIIESLQCNGVNCLVPVEMINYLDMNYIHDIEDYF